MTDAPIPSSLSVSMAALAQLAVECWRLNVSMNATGGAPAPARHAVRRIEDFLRKCELETQTLDGRPFDPGLPVNVIDAIESPELESGETVIAETLSPIVLWRGQVIKAADVVISKKG